MVADILIINDKVYNINFIIKILEKRGYEIRNATSVDNALSTLKDRRPSLIIFNIWLVEDRLNNLKLLKIIKNIYPQLPIIIIYENDNFKIATLAIHNGTYDCIKKPFKVNHLILLIEHALEILNLKRENIELKKKNDKNYIVGNSLLVRQLIQNIKKIALTNCRIYITGLSGTGKELIARSIHQSSHRSNRSFISINSTILIAEKMEEELFGIESTNGDVIKVGVLEESHGGTLMINEIGDMQIDTQEKFLQVLINKEFKRIGGKKKVKVDVRIITASSQDLRICITNGKFREDLYHRITVVSLYVPTLKERQEDIPILINEFSYNYCQKASLIRKTFSRNAIEMLQIKNWPGNIRELKNYIERLIILKGENSDNLISIKDIKNIENFQDKQNTFFSNTEIMFLPLRKARELFEKKYLIIQINRFSGNISKTANFIGMERSALHRKLKSLNIKI